MVWALPLGSFSPHASFCCSRTISPKEGSRHTPNAVRSISNDLPTSVVPLPPAGTRGQDHPREKEFPCHADRMKADATRRVRRSFLAACRSQTGGRLTGESYVAVVQKPPQSFNERGVSWPIPKNSGISWGDLLAIVAVPGTLKPVPFELVPRDGPGLERLPETLSLLCTL